jgi:hypothetical protein
MRRPAARFRPSRHDERRLHELAGRNNGILQGRRPCDPTGCRQGRIGLCQACGWETCTCSLQAAIAGLTSEAAHGFVKTLPSITDLMPRLLFAEVAGEADPPIAERLVSSNALRQRRFRERQATLKAPPDNNVTEPLRDAQPALQATERNADKTAGNTTPVRKPRGRPRKAREAS